MIYYNLKKARRKNLLTFLIAFPFFINAQGWSFQFNLAYAGNCGTTPSIAIPTIPNNAFQTRAQCESMRQQFLAINYSGGGCTVYYACTPCVGSDIIMPGQTNPGEISSTGQFEGKPLFTPHQSKAFEDWSKDYKQQLESYGIKSILGNSITPNNSIPSSGNAKVDKIYKDDVDNFIPKSQPKGTSETNDSYSGKTVPIMGSTPMTFDEQQRKKLIDKYGTGYIDPSMNFVNVEKNEIQSQYHPLIDLSREIGVTAAGWLGPAGYIGVAAVNIIAEDAKAINDVWNGKPCPSTETMLENAFENTKKDFKSKLPGDIKDFAIEKGADKAVKGFGDVYSNVGGKISIFNDLVGKNGIFDKIEKGFGIIKNGSSNPNDPSNP